MDPVIRYLLRITILVFLGSVSCRVQDNTGIPDSGDSSPSGDVDADTDTDIDTDIDGGSDGDTDADTDYGTDTDTMPSYEIDPEHNCKGAAFGQIHPPSVELSSSADVKDIWANSPDNVFVIQNEKILRYDGLAWNQIGPPDFSAHGIGGTSSGQIYAVGENDDHDRMTYTFDGDTWEHLNGPDEIEIRDVWVSPEEEILGVGEIWPGVQSYVLEDGIWESAAYGMVAWIGNRYDLSFGAAWAGSPDTYSVIGTLSSSSPGAPWPPTPPESTNLHYPFLFVMEDGFSRVYGTDAGNKFSRFNDLWGGTTRGTIVVSNGQLFSCTIEDCQRWEDTTSTNYLKVAGFGKESTFGIGFPSSHSPRLLQVSRYIDNWKEFRSFFQAEPISSWAFGSAQVALGGKGGMAMLLKGGLWRSLNGLVFGAVYDIWGSGQNDVVALTGKGEILHGDGTLWTLEAQFTPGSYSDLFGRGPNEIYACGTTKENSPVLMKYNGKSWQEQDLTALWSPFHFARSIWVASDETVYVVAEVGEGTSVLVLEAGVWRDAKCPVTLPLSTWGADANAVFVVGAYGESARWDGKKWTSFVPVDRTDLVEVRGVSEGSPWAKDSHGEIRKFNGATWEVISGKLLNRITGFQPLTETTALAWLNVASSWHQDSTLYYFDGAKWTTFSSQTTGISRLVSVHVFGPDDIVLVGGFDGSLSAHWDGKKWSKIDSAESLGELSYMENAYATSSRDIYAVFGNGAIAHCDGHEWSPMESNTTDYLDRIHGTSNGPICASGRKGSFICLEKGQWIAQKDTRTCDSMGALWGPEDDTALFGICSGSIMVFEDGVPKRLEEVSENSLYGLWGTSVDNIYAVGEKGEIWHRDATGWSRQESGTTDTIEDIWGSETGEVYVITNNGQVLHKEHDVWTEVHRLPGGNGVSILGFNDNYVLALGENELHVFDGVEWRPQENMGTSQLLASIWGSSPKDLYLGGTGATIYHGTCAD